MSAAAAVQISLGYQPRSTCMATLQGLYHLNLTDTCSWLHVLEHFDKIFKQMVTSGYTAQFWKWVGGWPKGSAKQLSEISLMGRGVLHETPSLRTISERLLCRRPAPPPTIKLISESCFLEPTPALPALEIETFGGNSGVLWRF